MPRIFLSKESVSVLVKIALFHFIFTFSACDYSNSNDKIENPKPSRTNMLSSKVSDFRVKVKQNNIMSNSIFNRPPIGWLDSANAQSISGWAYDKDSGNNCISVHIYINNQFYASVIANKTRQDLVLANVTPNPEHGFVFSVPILPEGSHKINVYGIDSEGGSNNELNGSPKYVKITNSPPIGYFDYLGDDGSIYGWAYDKDGGLDPVSINIYVDGLLFKNILANRMRPDLVSAGVAPNAYHGFAFTMSGLSPGRHTVDIMAIDYIGFSETRLHNSPKTVSIAQSQLYEPYGNVDSIDVTGCNGWVYDPDLGNDPVRINVFVDGSLYKSVIAENPRPDLVLTGVTPNPEHGFNVSFENLSSGTHQIIVYALDDSTGRHVSINNNQGSIDIPVVLKPDLEPLELTITPSNPVPGQYVQFNVRVKNSGNTATFDDVLVIYEIQGTNFVTYGKSGSLSAGNESYDLISLMPWQAIAEGTYIVTATIDPNSAIDEINENNNTITKQLIVAENTQNSAPFGWLDYADENGGSGWAYDSDAGTAPINVHIYVDNVLYASKSASLIRNDLVLVGISPNPEHGFNFTLTGLTAGQHQVRVYAIDFNGNQNMELMGSPKTIDVSSNPVPPICSSSQTVQCNLNSIYLPVVTHWTSNSFNYLGTDAPPLYGADPLANAPSYQSGSCYPVYASFIPDYQKYYGDKYSTDKIGDQEARDFLSNACSTSGVPFNLLPPASWSSIYPEIEKPQSGSCEVQIIHSTIIDGSLATVFLPPNWVDNAPEDSYPILFNSFYDLNGTVFRSYGAFISEMVAKSGLDGKRGIIGVITNGGGAAASRSMNENAYIQAGEIFDWIATEFHGSRNEIITFGGSRGGFTSLAISSNPYNLNYNVILALAIAPVTKIGEHMQLTSPTFAALLDATAWTTGLADSWKTDWTYPSCAGKSHLTGKNTIESNLYILTGNYDVNTINERLSPISNNFVQGLKQAGTQVYLEATGSDFICPYHLQVEYATKLRSQGVPLQTNVLLRAGHTSLEANTGYQFEYMNVIDKAIEKIVSVNYNPSNGTPDLIEANTTKYFKINRQTKRYEEFTPDSGHFPFTFEGPYKAAAKQSFPLIFVGQAGSEFKFNLMNNNISQLEIHDILSSSGISTKWISGNTIPVGGPYLYSLKIKKPGENWKNIPGSNTTTGNNAELWIVADEPNISGAPAHAFFAAPQLAPFNATNWGLSEY